MKVSKLIEELQCYNENMEIVLMGKSHYQWNIEEVLSGSLENGNKCVVIQEGEQR
jgi:hypothetical protein